MRLYLADGNEHYNNKPCVANTTYDVIKKLAVEADIAT